jgi:tripeptidyl-peptidase-1
MDLQEGPARETDLVHAVFVLKKCPMAVKKFESLLLDISTPSSANYGKWLSKDQVREMLAPEEESLFNVMGYLANEGIMRDNIKISELKDRVFVTLPASAAARMFDTEFARFRSTVNEQISLLRVTKVLCVCVCVCVCVCMYVCM